MATKDFIEYDLTNGNQNEVINVTASKNTSSIPRSTTLNISVVTLFAKKEITKTVNINQGRNDKIFIVVGSNGNINKIQLE